MPTWLCHLGDVCVLFICHKPEGGKNGEASDKTGAAVQETQVHTVPERKGQKKIFSHVQRNPSDKQGSCLLFHNPAQNILPKMGVTKGWSFDVWEPLPSDHSRRILPNDARHKCPLIWSETCILNFILWLFLYYISCPHFGIHLLWVRFNF